MKLVAAGRRGRMPTFYAKVGTMSGSVVVVKRVRDFAVGQKIQFAETRDLEGCSVGMAPRWRGGEIWKIEDNRLFINLV